MILNSEQQAVVNHPGGPLLVLACPGSGKTRCITERIISLLDDDVSPSSILAVTFTNKAANEMKERIRQRGYGHNLMISTFHSFCVKMLRKYAGYLGYKRNFSIVDASDQLSIMRRIIRSNGLDPREKKNDPKKFIRALENKKSLLIPDGVFEMNLKPIEVSIFNDYQKTLKKTNSMDFSDLIYLTVRLFQDNETIQEAEATRFKHILVDEMQDTNVAQLSLIKRLASVHNNIIVVGDADQCFPSGTLVSTPSGEIPIEEINVDDEVYTTIGNKGIGISKVTNLICNKVQKTILQIKLEDGSVLKCTPNHVIPMDVQIDSEYFIYLMYKEELGFRIGACKSSRQNGFAGRLGQEHGDKIWVIDLACSKHDASIKEQYWSVKYGIPTTVFHTVGRKIIYSESQIKWLHDNLDSKSAGFRLLFELELDFNQPHHMPRMGASKRGRYTFNVSMNSDRGMHRFAICSNNKDLISKIGTPRKARLKNWRIESSTTDMSVIDNMILEARKHIGNNMNLFLSLRADSNKALRCQPASNIVVGTILFVKNGDQISRKKVIKVSREQYDGHVYDLNIERTHNFIANNIVVHNSIYSWRNACVDNIIKFDNHFDEAKTTHLSLNYRCTPEILDVAEQLISVNSDRQMIKLRAHRGNGMPVQTLESDSPELEAEAIADKIEEQRFEGYDYQDMAILCRTNMLTRTFEECFRRRNIPYVLIGAFGFYDRKEIKTAINYMKFLANPEDALAFEEIVNTPSRGVGSATILKILEHAEENNVSFLDACRQADQIKRINKKAVKSLNYFIRAIELYDPKNPHDSLTDVFEETGFLDHLRATDRENNEFREDNVLELLRTFNHYCVTNSKPTLDKYLQDVMLMSSSDADSEDDAVKLMTVHAAKGLEFHVVFIPALEEESFPHKRVIMENNIEEERRVAYVAMTRAKDYLYLSRSKTRNLHGSAIGALPSRFLVETGFAESPY